MLHSILQPPRLSKKSGSPEAGKGKPHNITDCQTHHLLKLQGIYQICYRVEECIMHKNSISTINIMFNFMFNTF